MSTTEKPKLTATEVMESLTGFDEIAIEQQWGADISTLARTNVSKFSRALAFTLKRRDGLKDPEAKKEILGLTLGEVDAMFADDADDLPGSEAGKGGS